MIVKNRLILFILVSVVSVWSQEPCQTPNLDDGHCIPRTQCGILAKYFEDDQVLSPDQLRFLQYSSCSLDDPSYVCCATSGKARTTSKPTIPRTKARTTRSRSSTRTTTTTTTTTTAKVPPSRSLLPNPRQFECGREFLGDRILGGTDSALEEFPWYALLSYRNKKGAQGYSCGGTLISHRYVVTAAHCMENSDLAKGTRFLNVRLGEYNLATFTDCKQVGNEQVCANPPQDIAFEQVIVHPGYTGFPNQHNDIALIRLARDVEFNAYVTPICLPDATFRASRPGQNVTIAGFGHTGYESSSVIKHKAMVPIVSQQFCRRKFSEFAQIIDTQLCAGAQRNVDTCSGDSGGPLMAQRQQYWTIEGIVSYGNKCGMEGWPGVYTRVSAFVDWIRSVIRP